MAACLGGFGACAGQEHSMKKLTPEEFRLLKKRIDAAKNALSLSLTRCPELERLSVTLEDGHQLSASEVMSWLQTARSACWEFAPSEVRHRHLKWLMQQQPRG